MSEKEIKQPEWINRGKTISQLITELQTFDDPDLQVCISLDSGDSYYPISLVGKMEGNCVLIHVID